MTAAAASDAPGGPRRRTGSRLRRVALAGALAVAAALVDPVLAVADPPPRPDDTQRLARAYLAGLAGGHLPARLAASGSQLVALPEQHSLGVTVQRFDQTYHGLPVLGAQVVVRLRGDAVLDATADTATSLTVDTSPGAAPTQARAFAVVRKSLPTAASLRLVDRGVAIIPRGQGVLVRHVTAFGSDRVTHLPVQREVYVAAGAAAPVLGYSTILPFVPFDGPVATTAGGYNGPDLPLVVYRRKGHYLLKDVSRHATISTYRTTADAADFPLDLSRARLVATPSLPFPSTASTSGAIDAQWGAGQVLDYYADRFGRDSLDGHGMAVRSYVGLTYFGDPMANAAWTGTEMIYGSGDREYLPFSASLDVVGHEMTHGVIQHTSNLLYYGQPGAVNEAFADYFGNAIGDDAKGIAPDDPTYSLMGEDLCRTKPPVACAKFDLSRRRTTSSYYQGENDEQGVHRNSPIVSNALWRIRLALGGNVADRLAYAAMTQYLTPSSDFMDVRVAMLAAARDQGLAPAEVDTVAASFDANGIVAGWDRFRLEPGARIARSGLGYPSSLVDLRHGILVSTDLRGGKAVVLAGPTTGRSAHVLPGLTGDVVDGIATDGREVIVLGGRVRGFHQTSTVLVSSVNGGPARTLTDLTGHTRSVVKVAISRRVYAWQTRTYGPTGDHDVLVLRGRDGHTDRIRARGTVGAWAVTGRQLVFTDARSTRIRSFDAATGDLRTLWTPKGRAGFHPRIRAIALTPHRIVVVANRRPGPTTSVLTLDRSGHHRRVLLEETGSRSRVVSTLAASDRAITVGLPQHRLAQLDARTGRLQPVSCKPVRFAWAQGNGRRVAWIQQEFGKTAIVTRSSPLPYC